MVKSKKTMRIITLICVVLLVLALVIPFGDHVNATLGVDMSLQQCQTATLEHWKCLKRSGFDFGRLIVEFQYY